MAWLRRCCARHKPRTEVGKVVWRFDWVAGGASGAPAELAQRWDAAFEAHGNIWQCRHFALAWETHVAPRRGQTPILLVARDEARHEIVYPLFHHAEKARFLNRTEITPIGGAYYCDYQDPLSTGDAMTAGDLDDFWKALDRAFKGRLGLRLGRLSRFRAFRLHEPPPLASDHLHRAVAPYIRVAGLRSFEDFLARRSSNFRYIVKRGLRRLEDLGCTDMTMAGHHEIRDRIDELAHNYRRQWEGSGGDNQLDLPGTSEFWLDIAQRASDLGKLHLSTIVANGETWHWHLGFKHRDSVLWYKPTYNSTVAKQHPGMLHLAMIVREAITKGLHVVDLGFGSESYKYRWTDEHSILFPFESERYGTLLASVRAASRSRRGLSARLARA